MSDRDRQTLGLCALGAGLLLVHALYYRHLFQGLCHDDAYVSFRYADHLVHGEGLVFNRGERVEGVANFLWVLLLAPWVRLVGDPTLVSQMLGLGLVLGSMGLVVYALRRIFAITDPFLTLVAVSLVAGSGYVAAWSTAGLEGPLYGGLLLAAWMRYYLEARNRFRDRPFAAVLVGLLALARAEAVFLAIAAAGLHVFAAWRRGEPLAARGALLFPAVVLGIVLPYEIWRFAYYGAHLLPNSVRAKLGGGVLQPLRGILYVTRYFLWPYVPLVTIAAWPMPLARRFELGTGFGLLCACLLVVVAAGGDWSNGRFFAPLVPLATVLFTARLLEFRKLSTWLGSERGRRKFAGAALVYAGLAFLVTGPLREARQWKAFAGIEAERVAIGKWLRENMPADAVLAVHAAGEIPYYSRLYTHDMLGLNDAHIAALHTRHRGQGGSGHEKYDPNYTLEAVRPGIVVEGRRIPGLNRHGLYLRDYQPVAGFWRYHEVAVRRDLLARHRSNPAGAPKP